MTKRNYKVVGLHPNPTEGYYEVVTSVGGGPPKSCGHSCAEFGLDGLPRAEAAIVRKGLTAAGYDRKPPKGRLASWTCLDVLCDETISAAAEGCPACPDCLGPMIRRVDATQDS